MVSIKDSKYIGMRLKLRREELGLSQEKLGDMAGVTYQQIQKYEKGTNRVNVEMLQKIAQLLDVSIDFFFEGEGISKEVRGIPKKRGFICQLSPEEQKLIRFFRAIPDQEYRKGFLSLLRLASIKSPKPD